MRKFSCATIVSSLLSIPGLAEAAEIDIRGLQCHAGKLAIMPVIILGDSQPEFHHEQLVGGTCDQQLIQKIREHARQSVGVIFAEVAINRSSHCGHSLLPSGGYQNYEDETLAVTIPGDGELPTVSLSSDATIARGFCPW